MAEFSEAIEAQFNGATVRAAALASFGFVSGEVPVWPGFGDMVTDGVTYRGLGGLGIISSVSAGPGQAVEEMTFSLSADETLLANIAADAEESAGREVNVLLQFFDVRQIDENGNWVEWQPLDEPFQLFWGTMGPLIPERPEPDNDAVSARASRLVSVTASNAFINRSRPAFGFFTDRDQKARHSGDNIFKFAYRMADAKVQWPHFDEE